VYRQFGDQRGLRDAVMARFEEEAGVDLDDLRLGDVSGLTARVLEHVAAYPLEPRPLLDPTLVDANHRRREALRSAVAEATEGWTDDERSAAAGVLDLLWSPAPYERLVADWEVDSERAIATITWGVDLVERALREGDRPPLRPGSPPPPALPSAGAPPASPADPAGPRRRRRLLG
jgi:hypothetical protein